MSLTSWVKLVSGRLTNGRRRRGKPAAVAGGSTAIECLEIRALLAAFVVDTIVDESDGNLSAGDLSLREAIESANSLAGADTITFDAGIFGVAQTMNLSLGDFSVTDAVTITGPGQTLLTIDAGDQSRHFRIDDGDDNAQIRVEISGLTLTQGRATDGNNSTITLGDTGGSILAAGEELVVHEVTISDSSSRFHAGAIYSTGRLSVQDSHLMSNATGEGHGGAIYVGGSAVIARTEFDGNTAPDRGGAISVLSVASLKLNGGTLSGGHSADGGGLFNAGTAEVWDSLFLNNTAADGGGISNSGHISIWNSTFSGNRISDDGGGIYHSSFSPSITISNSTIVDNYGSEGGGIHIDSPVEIHNTIIAGNLRKNTPLDEGTPDDVFGTESITGGHNLIGDPGSAGGQTNGTDGSIVGQDDGNGGRELLDFSTLLDSLSDNGGPTQTHALIPGSPAIDAGDPDFDSSAFDPLLSNDQRGTPFDRVADGDGNGTAIVDIGAFEFPTSGGIVITESDGGTQVGESSSPDTFNVSLNRAPLLSVVVDLAVGLPSVVTLSFDTLTFTLQNWNQPQTVTVSGVNDNSETGNLFTTVNLAVNDGQSDNGFDGAINSIAVTFVDDDTPVPSISIMDAVAVTEGTNAAFTVSLSSASAAAVTVQFSTVDGAGSDGATGGDDFIAQTNQTLTFAPGQTQKTISVATTVDTDDETAEVFGIVLTNPTGATLATTQASGIINDNDEPASFPVVTSPIGTSGDVRPTITWTAVNGVSSYDLWLQLIGGESNPIENPTVTGTSHVVTADLTIGRYRAWVRANMPDGGQSDWGTASFQVSTAPTLQDLPLRSEDLTPTISWTAVNGATSYRLLARNRTSNMDVIDTVVGGTSFTPTADLGFGEYEIWVRAVGAGDYSAEWSDSTRIIVNPQLLTPLTSTFNQQPQFTWETQPDIASYQLFVRTGNTVVIDESGLTDTLYDHSAPFTYGKHRWWIRPTHTNGTQGGWSEVGEFFVGGRADVTGPVGTTSDGTPQISWNPVDGASDFEVYLFNDDGAGLIQRIGNLSGTTFDTVPAPDGNYRVWVKTNPEGGGAGIWSGAHAFVVDSATVSTAATPTSATGPTLDSTPTLTWSAAAEAVSFDVYLTDGQTVITDHGVATKSWTPTSAIAAGLWTWWVRSRTASGATGPWSESQAMDTTGRAILLTPAVTTSDRTPTITWSPVGDATHYIFQLDNLTTEQNALIRESGVESARYMASPDLTVGRYRVWVRAINGTNGAIGLWSFPLEFEVT